MILGSLVEGALLAVLTERDSAIRAQMKKGRPAQGLGLSVLIDMADKRGYIARDAKDFAHVMRQYRNFVHPRQQLDFNVPCDTDTVAACWHAGIMALNDLGSIPPSDGQIRHM
ncbi:MAG: hypothetical protein ACRDYA_20925 [Egibacteraceae bacterium]